MGDVLLKSVEENLKFWKLRSGDQGGGAGVGKNVQGWVKEGMSKYKGKGKVSGLLAQGFLLEIQIKDIIIRNLMISGQLIELLCDFRRTQSDPHLFFATPFSISDSLYNIYLQALLQTAETYNLQNTTKFMGKKYLDYFLCADSAPHEENLFLITLTCLRVAIKFNQLSEISQNFTIQYCSQLSQGKYTQEQFLACQIQLIKILQFKFRMTTPYDFLVVKNLLLPKEKKLLNLLESVIDFTITLIEVRCQTAEEIFFGALLYCCEQKKVSELCFSIIKATTYKWEEAQKISTLVRQKLNQLLEQ